MSFSKTLRKSKKQILSVPACRRLCCGTTLGGTSAKGHGAGRVVARRASVKSTVPDLAEASAVWNVRQGGAARRWIRDAQLAMSYRGDSGPRLMHAAPSFRLGCGRAEVPSGRVDHRMRLRSERRRSRLLDYRPVLAN